jgi:hypothetical protein
MSQAKAENPPQGQKDPEERADTAPNFSRPDGRYGLNLDKFLIDIDGSLSRLVYTAGESDSLSRCLLERRVDNARKVAQRQSDLERGTARFAPRADRPAAVCLVFGPSSA